MTHKGFPIPPAVRPLAAGLLLLCGGCGSVEVREARRYLLDPIPLSSLEVSPGLVLRVEGLGVAPHLLEGRLQVREEGAGLASWPYHRWAAPLGDLVTSTLYESFLRSRKFRAVLESGDSGEADLVLGGRILAFESLREEGRDSIHVVLALRLRKEADGAEVWQGCLEARVPLETSGPGDLVGGFQLALRKALAALPVMDLPAESVPPAPGEHGPRRRGPARAAPGK